MATVAGAFQNESQHMKISIPRTAVPPNKQLQLTCQLVTRLAR